jgi:hypothetical protein
MAAAAGSAAAAAAAQAIKAAGAVVHVVPREFDRLVREAGDPIVVHALTGVFSKKHQYLTAYKGLVFYTLAPDPLMFSSGVEVLESQRIWIPG